MYLRTVSKGLVQLLWRSAHVWLLDAPAVCAPHDSIARGIAIVRRSGARSLAGIVRTSVGATGATSRG